MDIVCRLPMPEAGTIEHSVPKVSIIGCVVVLVWLELALLLVVVLALGELPQAAKPSAKAPATKAERTTRVALTRSMPFLIIPLLGFR
jgi:hypothetical protein